MNNKKYTMNISLNVLEHLGINLYSNTPAVIAEVIANAWDAGATQVDINFDKKNKTVTVSDNGCGMDENDINHKYLYIGYQRRKSSQPTPRNRKPMGRKGIGKLSLFSIAEKVHVQSRKNGKGNALLMDAKTIKEAIEQDTPGKMSPYHPESVEFDNNLSVHQTGTSIRIAELKKRITAMSEQGLKKRLARRFSIIEGNDEFNILLNGKKIEYSDRDYFHKARFLFQYGEEDFSKHCKKLDKDTNGEPFVFKQVCKFDKDGKENDNGEYKINGWIAIAHHSNDLDETAEGEDDNLNNIVIIIRGKVAQEDILHQFRIGGLITKYIYGEIQADFLDDDSDEDITTSSRQKIMEDTPRYQALKKFIHNQLLSIRTKTDNLKKKKGVEKALDYHPKIQAWYDKLNASLKKKADALFGTIDQIEIDEKHKATLYVNGILAFEKMRLDDSLNELENIKPDNLQSLLKIFKEIDDIEAAHYYEIVNDRLKKIDKLEKITKNNEKEKVIQEYIFDHLWLLDPAWERATSEANLEQSIQQIIETAEEKDKPEVKGMRIDIQYKKVSGAHVIIELKKASRRMKKSDLEEQIKKYIGAVKEQLISVNKSNESIEGICIVGQLPVGWENEDNKQKDIESLKAYNVRILTYDELIQNAYSAYSKFIEKQAEVSSLRELIKEIRSITTPDWD